MVINSQGRRIKQGPATHMLSLHIWDFEPLISPGQSILVTSNIHVSHIIHIVFYRAVQIFSFFRVKIGLRSE